MRLLDITYKDILQIVRDWKSALFLIIMPILFTVFFGLVFNPVFAADQQKKDPRLPVGMVNNDADGLISGSLEGLLNQSDVIRPVLLGSNEANQAGQKVSKGEYAAFVIIPVGYSESILTNHPLGLEVTADQTTTSGRTAVTSLETVTSRLFGAVESANLSVEAYQQAVGFTDATSRSAYFEDAYQKAVSAWNDPPLAVKIEQATKANTAADQGFSINGFTQSSAGMIVQFAIFGLISSAMILVLERKTRCLQRMLTTPVKRVEIIGGHVLAMFLVVLAQEIILVLLGQFAFGVNYLRQPLAILLMAVVVALWAASLGLLIGAIAKKEEQVIVLCLIAMFLFSALGGAWFPLDVAGKAFAAIGHVMPAAWAMDGFQNIIMRGLSFASVVIPAGILMIYTVVFFGLALWRFRFEQ
jgi:ABC-2 type transport system permease protein